MSISGLSFQAPPQAGLQRSPAVANLRLLDEVSQILEKDRPMAFNDVIQIAQMLTLPEDIQPPTYNVQGVRTPYEPVPPHRLLEVIS
ncbi:MAG: hypothetical protein LBE99_04860, partial [Puniceicoccales bacterium]|nr:hypothetical protein [Puniceicoccales bacterium]